MTLTTGRTGRVAQLGERLVRNEEAGGSNPLSSTNVFNDFATLLTPLDQPTSAQYVKTACDLAGPVLCPPQTRIVINSLISGWEFVFPAGDYYCRQAVA